eukprot:CAMPEP_0117810418 /NCGR_PEP_ID=MMETSP0948-20121206/21390_1 /TAXON_ID=44440 /ORGANISM="Chattonella subsalsa, Strain CCMP2191" /LENGTH=166 /DNA_ID=CAMNT_0005646557 /DNA_START=364 /DNA_END=865 /DNA_ORIENTATION=-
MTALCHPKGNLLLQGVLNHRLQPALLFVLHEACVHLFSGGQLPQQDPEGIHVTFTGISGMPYHLRCDPTGGADPVGHAAVPREGHRTGRPPVPDFRLQLVRRLLMDEDVVALQVPMDDGGVIIVEVQHALSNIHSNLQPFPRAEPGPSVIEHLAQAPFRTQLGDDP